MPWNDASKPPHKPGPWDAATDETGGGEAAADKTRGRPRDAAGPKPSRSPWKREGERLPSREMRRAVREAPPEAAAPPPRGPHLDELNRQLRERLAKAFMRPGERRVRRSVLAGGLGVLAAAWALSGLYAVQADQTAVVTRFGAVVGRDGPGLRYHLPYPFESVRRLSVGRVEQVDLGAGAADGAGGRMLTHDGDLVDLSYVVQWRIADPLAYLAGLADPQASLRAAAASAMQDAVGRLSLGELLAADRDGAGPRAVALMQAALDREHAGIKVVGVEVRDVTPPDAAQAGFRALATARDDADASARQAQAYAARIAVDARADANKLVQASQGYRDQEVSEARGEADRFTQIDAQYRKAPQVTRDRLYTETMERVLHSANKVIVQTSKDASTQIVLPPDVFRPKPSDAQPPAAAVPSSPRASDPSPAAPNASGSTPPGQAQDGRNRA